MIQNPEIKIRILREIKGYTQENVANELKMSTKAYQKIESGETQLTMSKLNNISKVLNVDPIDILKFNEEQFFDKLKPKTSNSLKNNSFVEEQSNLDNNYINSLKEEIIFLRKIIAKNMDL